MENFENIVDNIQNTEIKPSLVHGHGLFATANMHEGTILGVLDGQYVPATAHFMATFEWNAIEKDLLLVRPYRTKYSFINHSRTPNAVLKQHPLRVVALQNIEIGQEITLDYRDEPLSDAYIEGHGKTYL